MAKNQSHQSQNACSPDISIIVGDIGPNIVPKGVSHGCFQSQFQAMGTEEMETPHNGWTQLSLFGEGGNGM
jgi:hypothetical protein